MALLRCGLPYQVVRASTWEPESAQAALRAVNPMGQIPTLQMDDGAVMTESAAILIHLGLRYPSSGLLPGNPAEQAQVLRGQVFVAANSYAAIGVIDYPERWHVGGSAAELKALREGARNRLHQLWKVFAQQFPVNSLFWGGEGPGALDLLAAVVSRWSGARQHLAHRAPELSPVFQRIETHPVLAPVFARHWPG